MIKRMLPLFLLLALTACAVVPTVEELSPIPEETLIQQEPPVQESEPTPPEPTVATLAVCGDIMSHMPITNDAWVEDLQQYDYTRRFSDAIPYISEADYAVGNFETTMAGTAPSGYPNFCAPDALAANLADAGFDMVLTANNHCMDKGISGLRRTLDVLDEAGVAHVGTYRTAEDERIHVADVGGISVAFLGYTYGTNGIPVPTDDAYAVSLFNTDYMTTLSTPDTETILADLAAAQALETDLIAVMIHWGLEYKTVENAYQQELADLFIENGADIILGGHSHVPQPMEMRTVTTQSGEERTGFVCYSLGNFISSQYYEFTDTTSVLTVELTRDNVTGESMVSGYRYDPFFMWNDGDDPERYHLLDIHKHLADETISDDLRSKLDAALANCHEIWGEEYDAGAAE